MYKFETQILESNHFPNSLHLKCVFLTSNFNCLGGVEASGLGFYLWCHGFRLPWNRFFFMFILLFLWIVFIDFIELLSLKTFLDCFIFSNLKEICSGFCYPTDQNYLKYAQCTRGIVYMYRFSIFVNAISIIFNILKFTVKIRGPKGQISCTLVQCATFLTDLQGRPSCFLIVQKHKLEMLLPVKFRCIPLSS